MLASHLLTNLYSFRAGVCLASGFDSVIILVIWAAFPKYCKITLPISPYFEKFIHQSHDNKLKTAIKCTWVSLFALF